MNYIVVCLVDGQGMYWIAEANWAELVSAYQEWYGGHCDRVLRLTTIHGGPVLLAASRISDLALSTPETRARQAEIVDAEKREQHKVAS